MPIADAGGRIARRPARRTAPASSTAASPRCRSRSATASIPQDLIDALRRRHGAPLRHVRLAPRGRRSSGPTPASRAAYRFLKRLWAFAQATAATIRDAGSRRRAPALLQRRVKAARRELHLTLKQANYDYERIQYNTVVSAGYEDAERAGVGAGRRRRGAGRAARRHVDPAARALPGRPARDLEAVARPRLRRRGGRPPRRALARSRRRGAGAGRDRARAADQRQDARQARRRGRCRPRSDRGGGRREPRSGEARRGRCGEARSSSSRGASSMSSSSRVLRPSRAGAPALAGVLAALAAVLLLGACGFQLRGEFKYPFSTIYVNAPEGNPINTALRRAIDGAGGARVVDSAAAAEVILDVPAPVEDKSVLSLSGGGRVREFALSTRVSFRLHDASGREWLPTSQIVAPPQLHLRRIRSAGTRIPGGPAAAGDAGRSRPADRASAAGGKTAVLTSDPRWTSQWRPEGRHRFGNS